MGASFEGPGCRPFSYPISDYHERRRSHPSIKQLLDVVGGKIELYDYIGSHLRSLFIQTNEAIYCTLRFDLLMAMHEADLGSVITFGCTRREHITP